MISRRPFRNRVLDFALVLVVACCVARTAGAVQIKLERTLKGDSEVLSVAFSPDGKTVASGTRNGIRIYDAETGKLKSAWNWRKDRTKCVVFSPDGQLLASGGEDTFVRLWNVRTARVMRVFRGHSAPIIGLAFSPVGSTLASTSASEDEEDSSSGELKVWNPQTGKLKRTLYQGSGVYPVVFSSDGKTLAAATGGLYQKSELHFWNAGTLQAHRVLVLHKLDPGQDFEPQVNGLVFNRNRLLVVSQDDSSGAVFRFFSLRNNHLFKVLRDEDQNASPVLASPDNKFLAVASDVNSSDQTRIHLRDTRTGQILQNVKERPQNIFSLAFSKAGLLAVGGKDGTIYLWRVK